MSIAGSCIGIEIAQETVRAVILNNTAEKIIGYAEVKRSSRPENPFGRLSIEIASLWSKLPEKFTGNVRVSAAFGDSETGVRSGHDTGQWLSDLEQETNADFSKVSLGDAIAYARSDVLASYQRIFTENEIPLERLELAPQAAARVIDSPGPVSGSIVSGVGWQFYISEGDLISAEAVEELECNTLKVKTATPATTLDLEYLHTLNVSQGLLDTFDIERLDLAVSIGTAKGLVTNEPHFRAATPNYLIKTLDDCAETKEHNFVIDLTEPIQIDLYDEEALQTAQMSRFEQSAQSSADAFSLTTPSILSDGWNSGIPTPLTAPSYPGEGYALAASRQAASQPPFPFPAKKKLSLWNRILKGIGIATIAVLALLGIYFVLTETTMLQSLGALIQSTEI